LKYSHGILFHELLELKENEAKQYLIYYGLTDDDSLKRVYSFTGGYPLCLMLARTLAQEIGWDAIRDFQDTANKDRVASQLLERILAQEKVNEVKDFLEKGVVTKWFNPESIAFIMNIDIDDARVIYDKIGQFSFIYPHKFGLKFHDRIRDILLERLKFLNNGETYNLLLNRWITFYEEKYK